MSMKLFASALLASTLIAAPALAQADRPAPSAPPAAAEKAPPAKPNTAQTTQPQGAAQTMQQAGQWRASKVIGLSVYNAQNESIGDINELVLGNDGKIELIVVGVGGFLGIGEHNVALKWDQVKFVMEARRTAATTTTTAPARDTAARDTAARDTAARDTAPPAGSPARTTTTTTTTGSGSAGAKNFQPDHAVVNMTKEQLKALPAFKYAS